MSSLLFLSIASAFFLYSFFLRINSRNSLRNLSILISSAERFIVSVFFRLYFSRLLFIASIFSLASLMFKAVCLPLFSTSLRVLFNSAIFSELSTLSSLRPQVGQYSLFCKCSILCLRLLYCSANFALSPAKILSWETTLSYSSTEKSTSPIFFISLSTFSISYFFRLPSSVVVVILASNVVISTLSKVSSISCFDESNAFLVCSKLAISLSNSLFLLSYSLMSCSFCLIETLKAPISFLRVSESY